MTRQFLNDTIPTAYVHPVSFPGSLRGNDGHALAGDFVNVSNANGLAVVDILSGSLAESLTVAVL